jgi:divalent metal cation (Fe/Co/Zn/Cd) transporter
MEADAPSAIRRRGYTLQYATIAWNLIEFAVTVALGVTAGSLALVAFGLDSLIEVFASAVVVWHLGQPDDDPGRRRTALALRLVAVAFATLAIALLVGSVHSLWSRTRPEPAPLGIAYLAVTAVVMFGLARMKRAAGTRIGNEPLLSEARMTRFDGWLAGGVLVALAGNALFSWWWADPLAGAAIALLAARESRLTWKGAVDAASESADD